MSNDRRRFPSENRTRSKSARRTRVLVAGVFVGAIAAMSLSWVLGWGFETEEERHQAREEAAAVARYEAFSSPPGTCLTWQAPDAADIRTVSCTEPHLFEVIDAVDISAQYPPNAAKPNDDAWRTLTMQRCGESAGEYLGGPLDPEGKLSIGVLQPDEHQWSQGERKLHCGLQRTAPDGSLQPLEAPVSELNQSDVWEEGTCLGIEDGSPTAPIDCAEEHAYEMVAVVNLANEFDSFPEPEDQDEFLDRRCNRLANEYSGDQDLREQGLIVTWDTRTQESWDAGSTLVNCKVAALLEDNSGLAPVRGSVSKDAEGQAQTDEGGGSQDGTDGRGENGGDGNNGGGNDGGQGNNGGGNEGGNNGGGNDGENGGGQDHGASQSPVPDSEESGDLTDLIPGNGG
ncbi:hypothetical protein BJF85_07495 [Saccharomonospora sp. CUA-673]|uniref:septum formation family protein n=1 Tax=Saccharomonospora sp. CUA-673 TaxID=1904969 RepID=UPI000965C843|nr:septum formation family protein [Saccharomonospora sp. CUA-673]OLT39053.1 hypothetical protein BJF85_07495 [Saccharomonospora sp. CUA-673]